MSVFTLTVSNDTKIQSCQCCYCYSKQSSDSRCCGLCYCACPSKKVENQFNVCNNNIYDFCSSGCIQTTSGTGDKTDECKKLGWDDCCCTMICLPLKLPLFLPCFIGSIVNECINKMAATKRNYLF